MARNSLLAINPSIRKKVELREDFDISDEGKELHSLMTIKRRDMNPITQMSDDIFNRDLKYMN